MMNKVLVFTTILVFAQLGNLVAQDVHFSQSEYAPLNLNPGLVGANSPLQAIVNYRSQWNSVATPFNTMAASVDGRINEGKNDKTGNMAAGLNFYNDAAGTNSVTTTKVNLNLAYHLLINSSSTIGLGLYGGFGQRSIGISDAQWGSQYSNGMYDPNYGTAEVLNNNQFSYFDAGAGAVYTFNSSEGYMTQNNQRIFNGGFAVYHVNRPSYSFITSSSEKLQMRWSVFFNGTIGLSNSKGALSPGIYLNKQGPASEILYGTYYRISMIEASRHTGRIKPFFYHFGLFHRWGDALIVKNIFEWHTWSAGLSYDVNISSLSRSSNFRGGFEIFVRYYLQSGNLARSRIN